MLICTWLSQYIGKEPRPNTSLVRRIVSCSCRDCQPLNVFLRDSTRSVGRFLLAKARRQQLHQNLDRAAIDACHVMERVGRPQTLVVTKTDTQYQKNMTTWRQRVATAKAEVAKFPQHDLRVILGTRLYELVKESKPVAAGGDAQSSVALLPTAGNGGRPSATPTPTPTPVTLPSIRSHATPEGTGLQSLPPLAQVIGVKRPAPGDTENIIDLTGDSD